MTCVQSYDDSCTKSPVELQTVWQKVFVALDLQAKNASSVHLLFGPSIEGSTIGTMFSIEPIGEHGMMKVITKESMTVHFSEPIEIESRRVKAIEFKRLDERNDDWKFLKCCLDVDTLQAKYQEHTARIINMPYESDLDPWFLHPKKAHGREPVY
jgi:hypothetical protein